MATKDSNIYKQEAEHMLGLLQFKEDNDRLEHSHHDSNNSVPSGYSEPDQTVTLFEPEPEPKESTSLSSSMIQKMNAMSPRRSVPRIPNADKILVDPERSIVSDGQETWLIPEDIAAVLRDREPAASDSLPQLVFDELEEIEEGEPGYWVTVEMTDGTTRHLPVYGYMADLGRSAAGAPRVTEELYWDNTEWLCRCAQCGRELPPMYFFLNTSGKPVGICKACTSVNKVTARVMQYPRKYWREDEQRLMVMMADLHRSQWQRGLAPRGDYAESLLGAGDVKERVNRTRHQRKRPKQYEKHAQASTVAKHLQVIKELTNG